MAPSDVDVGRGEIADALMISAVVVMIDECGDLRFVVLEQDAVLQCLVPAPDLALGLRVSGCTVNLFYRPLFQPFAQLARDVTRAIVGKQPWLVLDPHAVAA